MELWEKILIYSLALIFVVFFCVDVVSASDFGNFSLEQQNDACGVLNLSFIDCYDFWVKLNLNVSCSVDLSENFSVCEDDLNKSLMDPNCSIFEDGYVDDLVKIDDYKLRGLEPVFISGEIDDWIKIKNDTIVLNSPLDCSQECSVIVSQLKEQYEFDVDDSDDDVTRQNTVFMIFFCVVVFAIVIWNFGKKYFRNNQQVGKVPPADCDLSSPDIPISPKPNGTVASSLVSSVDVDVEEVKPANSEMF